MIDQKCLGMLNKNMFKIKNQNKRIKDMIWKISQINIG